MTTISNDTEFRSLLDGLAPERQRAVPSAARR